MKLRSALILLLCLLLGAAALGETECKCVELPGDFAPYGGGLGLAEDGSVCAPFVSGGGAYVLLKNMYAGGEGLGLLKLDAA